MMRDKKPMVTAFKNSVCFTNRQLAQEEITFTVLYPASWLRMKHKESIEVPSLPISSLISN